MQIRNVTARDKGMLAYMVMCWHNELPSEVRFFSGDAQQAERTANILTDSGPHFITRGMFDGNEACGGYSIAVQRGVFSDEVYGQLLCWYVFPKYRGTKLLGVKLLLDAIHTAKEHNLSRLEVNPWCADACAHTVLRRLGFNAASTKYMKRMDI